MKNKSKVIISILILVILALLGFVLKRNSSIPNIENVNIKDNESSSPIIIKKESIKENNFSGTKPLITGSGTLVDTTKSYIDQRVKEFRVQANNDVPDMKKNFGNDSPIAKYTIDINARYTKSDNTESIIIDEYVYTGGANGNSSYKVFTSSLSSQKILSLSDVVEISKQDSFTSLVKKELMNWRPEGNKESVVFPDEVETLTFNSFRNWSFSGNNLVIYFDKYEIGPGSIGASAFPIPYTKIKDFLVKAY